MFRLILTLSILLAMRNIPCAAQATDTMPALPTAKWPRNKTIDVKHIALDLKFDWTKRQAYGTASIQLVPFYSTKHIVLDGALLSIQSIQLSNGKALSFNYDGSNRDDAIRISLDRQYQGGEELTIVIAYHTTHVNQPDPNNLGGSMGKGLRFFLPSSNTPIRRKQIWSAGEPESNRYWFPGYDAPNDVRTTELKATVEKNFTVISNGNLMEVQDHPNGTRTFHYKADKPYPNYLTSIVVGEYAEVKQKQGNTTLHTFGYPDEKEAVEATVERLPDMVKFYSELLNAPFPNSHNTQVAVQDFPFPGGVGQQGAVTVSDNMIDDFRTHADFLYLWDGIESEGVLAQWFGNSISPRNWSHVWLSKSFIHYFDGLYTDYKNGHAEYLIWYHKLFEQPIVANDWHSGYQHPIVTQQYDDVSGFISDNHAKLQGAWVLRMLRKQLGEELWWKAIRHYIQSHAGKQVVTEDFLASIEESTGQSMAWFFDQWVYKIGRPSFEISRKYDAEQKQLSLTLRQIQKVNPASAYPQAQFFQGKMDIELNTGIITVWIAAQEENTFTFTLTEEPQFVNVDFESHWIKDIAFQKPINEWLAQLENSQDVLAKWDAIDSLVKMAKQPETPSVEKDKIKAALRAVVSSNSYWRLKSYALTQLRGLLTLPYDKPTIALLLQTIKREKSWLRATAINTLGQTKDARHVPIYLQALQDESDRVINAAAIALGKTKSPKAFHVKHQGVNLSKSKDHLLYIPLLLVLIVSIVWRALE